MLYKHLPNEVEAFIWGVDPEPDWFKEFCEEHKPERQFAANTLFLPTEMGEKHVQQGCYVFMDPDGYVDAENEDVFLRNYTLLDNPDTE